MGNLSNKCLVRSRAGSLSLRTALLFSILYCPVLYVVAFFNEYSAEFKHHIVFISRVILLFDFLAFVVLLLCFSPSKPGGRGGGI